MRALRVTAALLALLAFLLSSRPTRAQSMSAIGGDARVTMSSAPGLERDAARVRDAVERSLAEIAADLPDLPTPPMIDIRLVRDASELARVAPPGRGVPPWAIGVAYPDLGVLAIATRRGAHVEDPVATARHELAHLALGAALGDHAPRWLHEGFAYQHSAEWSWDRAETLAGMAWFGGIIPISELDARFPAEELPAQRAYAESYDFVGYLARRGRWEDTDDDGDRWPFRRFLRALGHGATLDQAAKSSFGKPLGELFDEWESTLSDRYMFAPIGLLGLAVWMLAAVLLALAWRRRRKQNRVRLARWDREERAADAVAFAQAAAEAKDATPEPASSTDTPGEP